MRAEYIDHMGNDLRVVNAARVSFNKESNYGMARVKDETAPSGFKWTPALDAGDIKLIKYLATHGHFTPFTHPQITLRETVPIFVARQRFKHVVGFTYNEVSRRYVDDTPEFHVPGVWRSRPEGSVKQGSGEIVIKSIPRTERLDNDKFPTRTLMDIGGEYHWFLQESERLYNDMLAGGIAPEQARMVLPQSMMTSYYVTGSLSAWARAYKLRIDSHAQQEIQDLAKQWDTIIRPLFPVSWDALTQ